VEKRISQCSHVAEGVVLPARLPLAVVTVPQSSRQLATTRTRQVDSSCTLGNFAEASTIQCCGFPYCGPQLVTGTAGCCSMSVAMEAQIKHPRCSIQ
jgi:hypothetical protein